MKAIVIGAGEVGLNIARHLVDEGHDVAIVDSSAENLARASDALDIQTVEGMGSHADVLDAAGARDADLLVAVTPQDEINMVACQMAHSVFHIKKKIARVRQTSYLSLADSHLYTPDNMPVDVIISPEREVAEAVVRTLAVPGAFEAVPFAEQKMRFIALRVPEDAPVLEKSVRQIYEDFASAFYVAANFRSGRLMLPKGADKFEVGDEVYLMCHMDNELDALGMFGIHERQANRIFIIGGGNVGLEIAKMLEHQGLKPRLLEKNHARAEQLSNRLSRSTVLYGEALDSGLMAEENVGEMDVVLSVTSDNPANILSSILAKQLGARHVITLVTQPVFAVLAKSLGLKNIISPQEITAAKIMQHVRGGNIGMLHSIKDGRAELLQLQIKGDSPLKGVPANRNGLPKGVRLCAILRDEQGFLPNADVTISEGDQVLMLVTETSETDIESLV